MAQYGFYKTTIVNVSLEKAVIAKVIYGNQYPQGHDWSLIHTPYNTDLDITTVHLVVYEFAGSMRDPVSIDRFDVGDSYKDALRAFLEILTSKVESRLRTVEVVSEK